LLIILIFFALAAPKLNLLFFNQRGAGTGREDDSGQEPGPDPKPDLRTVRIIAGGDITAHDIQMQQAHLGDGRYDFSPSFEYIAPYLRAADLAVADFETGQAGAAYGYHAYPAFNAPLELSRAAREAGIDLVATANNHSLDMGLSGLKATLDNLRAAGLKTFGTYKSREEQQAPLIIEVNGIRLAFLSYTYGTNGIPVPQGHEYAVNLIEDFHTLDPISSEIGRARAAGADLVAVYMHWGDMYVFEPTERQKEIARELAAAGADLILGGHQHVIQPMEWIEIAQPDGSTRSSLVTYSMGNFISNQHYSPGPPNFIPTPAVQYGLLVDIEITKDMESGETRISGADYEIIWVHRLWRHRILPLSAVFSEGPAKFNLTEAEHNELQKGFQFNQNVVERFGFSANKPAGVK
jgi:poly-gamma-glutamate synthesis protein (capsule biosynthesis protein)